MVRCGGQVDPLGGQWTSVKQEFTVIFHRALLSVNSITIFEEAGLQINFQIGKHSLNLFYRYGIEFSRSSV